MVAMVVLLVLGAETKKALSVVGEGRDEKALLLSAYLAGGTGVRATARPSPHMG
jgi:hypothetical protein